MSNSTISIPAGYAPAFAIGYSSEAGNLTIVDGMRPLPVQTVEMPTPEPLTGSTSISLLAGPIVPTPGRPVMLVLSGAWTGTVQLQRSSDLGATRQPVTIGGEPWGHFTANACEPAWIESEADAHLYLDIALTSGTLSYRMAQ